MGDANAALTRMRSRYQTMVNSSLSTLWEGWGIGADGYGGGSYNHGWSGGPLTLLMEYVCGIAPTEPGFSRFQIMPQLGDLKKASASVETVKGTIRTSILKIPSLTEIKITVPATTKATVGVPALGLKRVRLNDKLCWKNGHYLKNKAVPVNLTSGRIGFELPAGEWTIEAKF
jgi:hypothetical protein